MMRSEALIMLVLLLGVVPALPRWAAAGLAMANKQSVPTTPIGSGSAWPLEELAPATASPLLFIENAGQFDARVRFQVRGGDQVAWLTDDAIWFTLVEHLPPNIRSRQPDGPSMLAGVSQPGAPRSGSHVRVSFPGANPDSRLKGAGRLATQVSYLTGNDPRRWRSGVPVWRGVRFESLYPGLDLEITGEAGRLALRIVADGSARADQVRLAVEGADRLILEDDHLRLFTANGDLAVPLMRLAGSRAELPPAAISGHLVFSPFIAGDSGADTAGRYAATAGGLVYASFLGGTDDEHGNAIAVDTAGAAYVAGAITTAVMSEQPGPFESPDAFQRDAILLKVSPDGSTLAYAAILGGSDYDNAFALSVDGEGAAYVGGTTWSLDFPTTPGAFDPVNNGGISDPFIVKVSPSGASLEYGTFLGGSVPDDMETVWDISVDREGAAFVTGWTGSADFPTTPGAFDRTQNGGASDPDPFVVKLSPDGSSLEYSSFVGGFSSEKGFGITALEDGTAIVAGYSYSADFPTTPGAFDRSLSGCTDAFVLRMNAAGSDLLYSTFAGGSDCDYADGLAADESGAAYITGETRSADFPTTSGAFDPSYNGNVDAFVAKLNPGGSALDYATYVGGGRFDPDWSDDAGWAIAVDDEGVAYVTGATRSVDFPTTPFAFDVSHNGYFDLFLVKLSAAGSSVAYGTFMGGSELDQGLDVKVDGAGMVYLAGDTESVEFPTTPGVFAPQFGDGETDGLVAKFALKDWKVKSIYLPVISRH